MANELTGRVEPIPFNWNARRDKTIAPVFRAAADAGVRFGKSHTAAMNRLVGLEKASKDYADAKAAVAGAQVRIAELRKAGVERIAVARKIAMNPDLTIADFVDPAVKPDLEGLVVMETAFDDLRAVLASDFVSEVDYAATYRSMRKIWDDATPKPHPDLTMGEWERQMDAEMPLKQTLLALQRLLLHTKWSVPHGIYNELPKDDLVELSEWVWEKTRKVTEERQAFEAKRQTPLEAQLEEHRAQNARGQSARYRQALSGVSERQVRERVAEAEAVEAVAS